MLTIVLDRYIIIGLAFYVLPDDAGDITHVAKLAIGMVY